jgi:hypothetical protein
VSTGPLSPDEFALAWGNAALVRVPAGVGAAATIPPDAREFLVQAGLPALVHYFPGSTDAKMTFSRLASGLTRASDEPTVGPPLRPEWSAYWVLGDEFFCNGSAWWCIREGPGHVCRADIELSDPVSFANSSVGHFASALLAACAWSDRYADQRVSKIDNLREELRSLDPPSIAEERNFWPNWLDFIECEKGTLDDAGVRIAEWRKVSRADGERALRDGPW